MYENINDLCIGCGFLGHKSYNCPTIIGEGWNAIKKRKKYTTKRPKFGRNLELRNEGKGHKFTWFKDREKDLVDKDKALAIIKMLRPGHTSLVPPHPKLKCVAKNQITITDDFEHSNVFDVMGIKKVNIEDKSENEKMIEGNDGDGEIDDIEEDDEEFVKDAKQL
uniref:CCHC-type domain-containing protein n=1 Tax=Nelumbo nucifera TaxID=4432 RepID=A0A822YLX0_NELNU|nr:TPA_asm: hypothetical protein HUJ06_011924 [Nelumbo nucifera]